MFQYFITALRDSSGPKPQRTPSAAPTHQWKTAQATERSMFNKSLTFYWCVFKPHPSLKIKPENKCTYNWHLTLLYHRHVAFSKGHGKGRVACGQHFTVFKYISLRCFSSRLILQILRQRRATQRWPCYSFDPRVSVFSPSWVCYSKLPLPLGFHRSVSCILSQKSYIFLHNDCCNTFIGLEMWLEDIKVDYTTSAAQLAEWR